MKQSDKDKIDELQDELELLRDELDNNELEQDYLRSMSRELFRNIEKIEKELEGLE